MMVPLCLIVSMSVYMTPCPFVSLCWYEHCRLPVHMSISLLHCMCQSVQVCMSQCILFIHKVFNSPNKTQEGIEALHSWVK